MGCGWRVTVKAQTYRLKFGYGKCDSGIYLPASASNVYIADNYAYRCQYGAISHGDNVIIEMKLSIYVCMVKMIRIISEYGEKRNIRGYCHGTVPGSPEIWKQVCSCGFCPVI